MLVKLWLNFSLSNDQGQLLYFYHAKTIDKFDMKFNGFDNFYFSKIKAADKSQYILN